MTTFLSFIISIIGDLFNSLIDAFAKPKGFSAQYGRITLIAKRYYKGIVVASHRKLTRRKSHENVMISGPTGSGKTSRLLIPTIFSLKNVSLIINDTAGEFSMFSGYLTQFFDILPVNFSNAAESCGYNLLSRAENQHDINKIAHLLVAASLDKGNASDPFWSLSVKTLLQILIRLTLLQPVEYRNMANVVNLLHHFAANAEKVDQLIAKSNDKQLILEYKSFISTSPKVLQSIVISAKSALTLFTDPEIAKTTAYDTIDFTRLRQKPTIILLRNSVSDQKYLSVLNSLFFEQLYGHILQHLPTKKELDLFIILEEASSLFIPLLPLAVANCRKHRVGTLICVQSPGQLKSLYKDEADNIAANCVTKIFLPGQTSMDTLREIETLSGKCIYKDEKGVERVKPLISTDEIRILPENRSLILSGNKQIIKGRTSPYWRNLNFRRYAKIPPVPLQGDIPDTPVPLLI